MNPTLLGLVVSLAGFTPSNLQEPPKKDANQAPSDVLDVKLGEVRFKYQPPLPKYPKAASEAGISGNVFLVIVVDEEGKVELAKALSGPPELYSVSEEFWSKHLFYPYQKEGRVRAVRFTVVAPWRLSR